MILDVFREKKRLDDIFALTTQMEANDELLAHWAKYLCVLTSGFIENSLRMILTRYAADKASSEVSNFVESCLKGVTNTKTRRGSRNCLELSVQSGGSDLFRKGQKCKSLQSTALLLTVT